jgi:hypothetical protein
MDNKSCSITNRDEGTPSSLAMGILHTPGAMSEKKRTAQQQILAGMDMNDTLRSMNYDMPRVSVPQWTDATLARV